MAGVAEPVEITTLLDVEIHEARLEVIDHADRRVISRLAGGIFFEAKSDSAPLKSGYGRKKPIWLDRRRGDWLRSGGRACR